MVDESAKAPWWTPLVAGVLIALLGGYIGLVHHIAEENRREIKRIMQLQDRSTYIINDLEDLKKRMVNVEHVAQGMPYIVKELNSVSSKLDRIIDQRQGP